MSDKEKINLFTQLLNNCIEGLFDEGKTEREILELLDTTPDDLYELGITIM